MRFSKWRLRNQLIALVVLAFLAGQVLSIWILTDERSLAVQAALGTEAAGRAANVAKLLETAPATLHEQIVQAATSPLVRFEISEIATVTEGEHHGDTAVSARVRALLGDNFSRDVRVEVHEIDRTMLPVPNLSPELAELHADMMRGSVATVELEISIALSGGSWLNVGTQFERPPWQVSGAYLTSFMLSAGLIIVALFWFAIARLTRPLSALTRATEEFGRGDSDSELVATGPAEVRALTRSFNTMRERLTRYISDRTFMLAAIAHDLRSPLTALRVQSEMVEDVETRSALNRSIEEMSAMINSTMVFAKDLGETEPVEEVSISEIIKRSAQHVDVALIGQQEFKVLVRPDVMVRALRNLLENATRYGSDVRVDWESVETHVEIRILDSGPGIPEEMLERVFEPYFRLEESRSRKTGGTGLGLSIARSTILLHGGDLSLSNRLEGGLVATVILPLNPTSIP